MSSNPIPKFMTVEEYLEHERQTDWPSEYFNGEIFPLQATSIAHGRIVVNVSGMLYTQLKGKPCHAFGHATMVRIAETGLYTYPDIVVICGGVQPAEGRGEFATNPTLIIEILSPSTENYDLGKKFEHYQTLPTLLEYVTIAQDKPRVGLRTRQAHDGWLLTYTTDIATAVELTSVGCSLPLADIYEGIEWPKEGGGESHGGESNTEIH